MLISIDNILNEIKLFYSSQFWSRRYYKRLLEEHINISLLPVLLEVTNNLIKDVKFKTYKDDLTSNGLSYGKIIELNRNIDVWEKDISHFKNLIMHEFGHLQYNLSDFIQIVNLNRKIVSTPSPIGLETKSDYKYFSDHNEIRLRIIPIIKDMYDNKWTVEETYEKSCKYDDIFDLYNKDQIIYWINNIL